MRRFLPLVLVELAGLRTCWGADVFPTASGFPVLSNLAAQCRWGVVGGRGDTVEDFCAPPRPSLGTVTSLRHRVRVS